MVNPKLVAIKGDLDQIAIQKARLQEERPRRTVSVTRDDVLDALREIERLVSDAEAEEVASFVRGLIDEIVVDGDTLTIHYAFKELEGPEPVAQLWLPGQVLEQHYYRKAEPATPCPSQLSFSRTNVTSCLRFSRKMSTAPRPNNWLSRQVTETPSFSSDQLLR